MPRARFGGWATDQEGWGVWLKAAGAKTVDPGRGLQLDASLAAFEMAINSAGVALGRKSLSGTVESSSRLVAPFDLEVPIDEAFHLIAPIAPGGPPMRRYLSNGSRLSPTKVDRLAATASGYLNSVFALFAGPHYCRPAPSASVRWPGSGSSAGST